MPKSVRLSVLLVLLAAIPGRPAVPSGVTWSDLQIKPRPGFLQTIVSIQTAPAPAAGTKVALELNIKGPRDHGPLYKNLPLDPGAAIADSSLFEVVTTGWPDGEYVVSLRVRDNAGYDKTQTQAFLIGKVPDPPVKASLLQEYAGEEFPYGKISVLLSYDTGVGLVYRVDMAPLLVAPFAFPGMPKTVLLAQAQSGPDFEIPLVYVKKIDPTLAKVMGMIEGGNPDNRPESIVIALTLTYEPLPGQAPKVETKTLKLYKR